MPKQSSKKTKVTKRKTTSRKVKTTARRVKTTKNKLAKRVKTTKNKTTKRKPIEKNVSEEEELINVNKEEISEREKESPQGTMAACFLLNKNVEKKFQNYICYNKVAPVSPRFDAIGNFTLLCDINFFRIKVKKELDDEKIAEDIQKMFSPNLFQLVAISNPEENGVKYVLLCAIHPGSNLKKEVGCSKSKPNVFTISYELEESNHIAVIIYDPKNDQINFFDSLGKTPFNGIIKEHATEILKIRFDSDEADVFDSSIKIQNEKDKWCQTWIWFYIWATYALECGSEIFSEALKKKSTEKKLEMIYEFWKEINLETNSLKKMECRSFFNL